ncbi:MAG: rhodanese-like domain-containing protein [Alphaproteobacteria bacterium]|nr:rhodanese-like domain-containing protein [Alphaproteobacteria bacterium]
MPSSTAPAPLEIDVKTLKAMMDSGEKFMLLDVREKDEYARAKIEGADLIPMGQVPSRISEVTKDYPLVVHCHHGGRSAKVVSWLRQNGFANASNLSGGIDAWSVHIDPTVARY